MNINELKKHWEEFGRTDPLWAILTDPELKGNKWDVQEFFLSGVQYVDVLMERITAAGLLPRRRTALDFGCGVGRLTQGLATQFDEVHGVDIGGSMIEHGRQHNRHGDKCTYHVNTGDDLRMFADDTFDLILSYLVLQHIEPYYTKNYLREFVRVLAPGGLLIFQLPSRGEMDGE